MPSKKIINNRFTILRNWLFPGLIWDSAPPDIVDGSLRTIVDIEHFVPVPRFYAEAISSAAGIGRASVVLLENFVRNPRITSPGDITTAKPTQFLITDIKVKQVYTSGAPVDFRIESRGRTDYQSVGFTDPLNLDALNPRVFIPAGDSNFAGVYTGDVAHPSSSGISPGPTQVFWGGGNASSAWVEMPDLAPGQSMMMVAQSGNADITVNLMWTERRPPAQPNIFPV